MRRPVLATATLLAALDLAGCLTPGATDDTLSAASQEAGDGATKTVKTEAEGEWTLQAAGASFVGSGWPGMKLPGSFVTGNLTFSWESAAPVEEVILQLRSRDGDVLWEQSAPSSPATFAVTPEDLAGDREAFPRLHPSGAGGFSAAMSFHVLGVFEVADAGAPASSS